MIFIDLSQLHQHTVLHLECVDRYKWPKYEWQRERLDEGFV